MALKKREKNLLKALGGVAVVSGIILYRTFNPSTSEPVEVAVLPTAETSTTSTSATTSSTGGGGRTARSGGSAGGGGNSLQSPVFAGVSLDDFQTHNTYRDCWITIGDDVYDVSNYLENNQSWAQEIGQYCGTLGFEFGFGAEYVSTINDIKEKAQNLGPLK